MDQSIHTVERCIGEVMKNIFGTKMLLMFAYEDASELRVKNKTNIVFFFFFFFFSLAQFDCFELNLHVNFQELPNKLLLLIWTMLLPDSVNQ